MNVLLGSPLDLSGCIMHRASCFIGWISFKIPFQTVPRVPSAQLSPQRTSLLFLSFMILFFASFFLSFCVIIILCQPFFFSIKLSFFHSIIPSFFHSFLNFQPFSLSSLLLPFHSTILSFCIAFLPLFFLLHLCFCLQDRL